MFVYFCRKLLVPRSTNDLLHPEYIKPITYQELLNPSHNHRPNAFFNKHNFVTFLKPIFKNPLRNFYNNHLKHFTRKPIFSPFHINAGIDLTNHNHLNIKPIVEHIEDDFKYDFRTNTHSYK